MFPASQHIYAQAVKEGLVSIFLEAGCEVINPTCGPCLGLSCGVLWEYQVCLATTNRNYDGRMGKKGMVHLASPVVAAYSAMFGEIAVPDKAFCAEIKVSIFDQAAPIEFEKRPVPKIDYRALSDLFKTLGGGKDFSGRPFYLAKEKVNTDEIISSDLLTKVDKKAFGQYCLETLVTGKERDELKICKIIVANNGFGDGSSREQAPWALEGMGIGLTCIIAKSFERIFENNFFSTGNLAATLPEAIVDELFATRPDHIEVTLDTGADEPGYVEWNGKKAEFAISELQKSFIRKGGSTGVMFELAAELQAEGKL